MRGRRIVGLVALIAWLVMHGQPFAQGAQNSEETGKHQLRDAFNTTVGAYFQLLAMKDPALVDHFTRIASDSFRCVWRDEGVQDKKQWLAYLQQYLDDATTHLRYEYEIIAIRNTAPNRVTVQISATEVRAWSDVAGLFGFAGQTLEFREPFDIDIVIINEKGEWKWEQLIFYGMGKRAFEQANR